MSALRQPRITEWLEFSVLYDQSRKQLFNLYEQSMMRANEVRLAKQRITGVKMVPAYIDLEVQGSKEGR